MALATLCLAVRRAGPGLRSQRSQRSRWSRRARGEEGVGLLDIIVGSAVLLIILVPASQLLDESATVVGTARSQAIAENIASGQIEQDRATWTSTLAAPTYASSSACGTAYSPSTVVNSTYNLYLTGCQTTSGMKFWIFQNGGWCVTSAGNQLKTSGTGTVHMYWVEVMVAWGGSSPPSPTTVVSLGHDVVMTSALQTPNGYTGSTSASCPL
ncbi:MAG: hypothetical protein ACYDD4_02740 [Acidimicrobiales bacterium]